MLQEKAKNIEEELFTLNTDKEVTKFGAKITGSYSTDLDIVKIHLHIRDIFLYNVKEKLELIKKSALLESQIKLSEGSYLKKQNLIKERIDLEDKLHIFSEEGWEEYVSQIRPIIIQYNTVNKQQKSKRIFIGSKPEGGESEDPKKVKLRLHIIRKFLRIAKKYINIDIICYPPFKEGCDECGISIEQMSIDEEQGVYICECNLIFGRVYTTETSNIDPDKIDNGCKNSYDDKTNFIRRLKSYQGIQNKKISPDVLNLIDKHMQSKYGIESSEKIKEMPMDIYGRRGTPQVSVKLLIEALKETDNNIHFQDINPICYELWGWQCPSIQHLIPKILSDYTKTQEVYKKMNPNLSSINVELRLYWHLRIAGHECCLEDFKIPQSRDSRKRNSCIFKKMCEEVGLKFYPII